MNINAKGTPRVRSVPFCSAERALKTRMYIKVSISKNGVRISYLCGLSVGKNEIDGSVFNKSENFKNRYCSVCITSICNLTRLLFCRYTEQIIKAMLHLSVMRF